mmetsp:Transcript_93442/g.288246  ORF Transcript_93442/g.288246 Transcript_93442/m.288246 type:complete len:209 (+) Transcript_93442:1240-1866(+)
MLVVAAHRGREAFRQLLRNCDAAFGEDDAGAIQDHGELGVRQDVRGRGHGLDPARGPLKVHARWDLDLHHLAPHVPRDVHLGRRTPPDGLLNHAVQHLRDPRWIAELLLVTHAVLEHVQLLDLLEPPLADRLVGRLGRDQEQRRVVPIRGLHGRNEVGDPWTILSNHHGHIAGGAAVPVRHHAGVALVGAVPELDARCWEEVGDRHHR